MLASTRSTVAPGVRRRVNPCGRITVSASCRFAVVWTTSAWSAAAEAGTHNNGAHTAAAVANRLSRRVQLVASAAVTRARLGLICGALALLLGACGGGQR